MATDRVEAVRGQCDGNFLNFLAATMFLPLKVFLLCLTEITQIGLVTILIELETFSFRIQVYYSG